MTMRIWLIAPVLAAVPLALAFASSDSARLVGDTVFIEPLGARFTIPASWMGRKGPPDRGRTGCQSNPFIGGPLEDRTITEPSRLATLAVDPASHLRVHEDALNAILKPSYLVAHVGTVPLTFGCLAPQVHVYVAAATDVRPRTFAANARSVLEQRKTLDLSFTEADTQGWHRVSFSWRVVESDFRYPTTLDIWSRAIGSRVVIVAVMDRWYGPVDTAELLSSWSFNASGRAR